MRVVSNRQKAEEALAKHGSQVKAALALGVARQTLQRWLHEPERPPQSASEASPITATERKELTSARRTIADLRRQLSEVDSHALMADAIRQARGALDGEAIPPPDWALRQREDDNGPGVPVLLVTDWHIGETVRESEVYGKNVFNEAEADERVRLLVERAIMLSRMHEPAGGYEGGVVLLGGDFVSGWLHEELVRTDWCSPMAASVWCVSRLKWALEQLVEAWGSLYVVGVPGNHGRLTKRPPAKMHAQQTFDWLIYSMLAEHFVGDDRVTFSVPDDGEQIVDIAGTRYLVTHGHQLGVKGGDGIIGALGPISRGATKVGRANRSVGRDFDVLVIGHYHTWLWLPGIIVGPTLKGFDEYARVSRFSYEPASQLLFFSHERWGPNMPLRIFLQDEP